MQHHPFGLSLDHQGSYKILQDAKEIAAIAGIVLMLCIIGVAISAFVVLTRAGF